VRGLNKFRGTVRGMLFPSPESVQHRREVDMAEKEHGLLHYFATLSTGRMVLWCYLIWYLNVLIRYFDPSPRLWLTSLGISAVVGFALILSTSSGGASGKRDGWQTFRLFLMPFCVSSFSAMVKGHGFVVIFAPELEVNLLPLIAIAAFCIFVTFLNVVAAPRKHESAPNSA
jgi:hypothetical protein